MKFNLLSKNNLVEGIIEYNVFDDLGFIDLLESVFEDRYLFITQIINQIPDAKAIEHRRSVFNDFLDDESNLLEEVKDNLDLVIEAHTKYTESKSDFRKHVNFMLFIKTYLIFLNDIYQLVNTLKLNSLELVKFKEFITSEYNNPDYINMKSDLETAYLHFTNMQKFTIKQDDRYIKVVSLEGKQKLDDKLFEIAKRLDIYISNTKTILIKEPIDNHYLFAIKSLYEDDYNIIQSFYEKYRYIEFDLENLSSDFRYYLFFKKFFKEIASNNIPYSPSQINDQGIIDFKDAYDISLINRTKEIVPNNIEIDMRNFIQLVTGVNSGGKTSYIRSLGLNYILFLSVGFTFSKASNLYPIKNLLTHFPIDENFKLGFGRLNDELQRLRLMEEFMVEGSLLILNETFSSTDEDTALKHTKEWLDKIIKSHVFCIYVTHQQKLFIEPLNESITVLSPVIDSNASNKRLYKLEKIQGKPFSYTYDILYKYGLTKDQLLKKLEDKE